MTKPARSTASLWVESSEGHSPRTQVQHPPPNAQRTKTHVIPAGAVRPSCHQSTHPPHPIANPLFLSCILGCTLILSINDAPVLSFLSLSSPSYPVSLCPSLLFCRHSFKLCLPLCLCQYPPVFVHVCSVCSLCNAVPSLSHRRRRTIDIVPCKRQACLSFVPTVCNCSTEFVMELLSRDPN